jgi:hypothetical protein
MAMPRRSKPKFSVRDMAEEIVRRVQAAVPNGQLPYVICLSEPPTPEEQPQLMACQLVGKAVAIVPWKAQTIDEWIEEYAPR